jgi:hypothetical protein
MEDLVRYLDEIVEPTVAELEKNPTSVRHAFLACVAVFHAVDYLAFRKSGTSRQMLRNSWGKESDDFAIIDRVAHAFKHVVSGHRKDPKGEMKAYDVISRPPATWNGAVWDLSYWDDADGGVTLDTDRTVDLVHVVRGASEFLRRKAR